MQDIYSFVLCKQCWPRSEGSYKSPLTWVTLFAIAVILSCPKRYFLISISSVCERGGVKYYDHKGFLSIWSGTVLQSNFEHSKSCGLFHRQNHFDLHYGVILTCKTSSPLNKNMIVKRKNKKYRVSQSHTWVNQVFTVFVTNSWCPSLHFWHDYGI